MEKNLDWYSKEFMAIAKYIWSYSEQDDGNYFWVNMFPSKELLWTENYDAEAEQAKMSELIKGRQDILPKNLMKIKN